MGNEPILPLLCVLQHDGNNHGWMVRFWLTHGAVVLGAAGALCRAPEAWAAPPPASPGFAEIAAPSGDPSISIEPRTDERYGPSAYAIENVPGEAASRSVPPPAKLVARQPVPIAPTAPELASLPSTAPSVVVIRFDMRRQADAAAAAFLAARLTRRGVEVREVTAAGPIGTPGIGFVFAEDRPAAEALLPLVPAAFGHFVPGRIDPNHAVDPQPGIIQITLGEERSTS